MLAEGHQKKLYGEVRRFAGSEEGVVGFALSPDGKKMASGCWVADKETVARVWDVKTGKELMQLKGHDQRRHLPWTGRKDGKRILTGSVDRSVAAVGRRGRVVAQDDRQRPHPLAARGAVRP